MTTNDWWRGAVIYQIYPRSYADYNGDGIGDLQGITEKLDYIASLNVDAIWLSPFFTSPMKDFGYDISNYCDVDPMFGTMVDFKKLVEKAHSLNLKVMIDQVYSHTSDQHDWFKESRQNRGNDKADWYVWADAKPDGTAPNNWLSIFGGSAWQWDSRRHQYYLHNFLSSQPDLNFHNADVQKAILDTARFWLELGVDGFRLDVVNMYFHDENLNDNPVASSPEQKFVGVDEGNPFCRQYHINQMCRDDNLAFLKQLRKVMDHYPGSTTVGEIGAPDGMSYMAQYTSGGDKLHMAYTFELLGTESTPHYLRETLKRIESKLKDGWPSFALSNHDVVRSATRWAEGASDVPAKVKAMMTLLVTQRGTPCIYQGEELGLPEANVPYEQIQDPFGIEFWPEFKGRDGCRTPIPWRDNDTLGFGSSTSPWLPYEKKHGPLSVGSQSETQGSVLTFVRELLAWRKTIPAIVCGQIRWLHDNPELLVFERFTTDAIYRVCINLTEEKHKLMAANNGQVIRDSDDFDGSLLPFQCVIFQVK